MTQPGTKKPARTSIRVVRELFEIIDARGLTLAEAGRPARKHPVSMSQWRHGKVSPLLVDFEAVAEGLGYRLVLEPLDQSNNKPGT